MVINQSNVAATVFSRARGPVEEKAENPQPSSTSFADQLAAAIEQYLAGSGNGSRIEIGVESAPNSAGTRQFIITVKEPGAAQSATAATPAAPAPPAAGAQLTPAEAWDAYFKSTLVEGGMMGSGTVKEVSKTIAPPKSAAPQTVDDAYWAMQPPEVQVLRDIGNEAERAQKALELSGQGFAIDVPIMVWRWDPLMTMRARQSAGYTWVPAAGQASVEVAPGISFPGKTSYDPLNPPAGSIRVSTEWARGLENTSPWWRPLVLDGQIPGATADPQQS